MARDSQADSAMEIGRRLRLIRIAYGVVQGHPREMPQNEIARLCNVGAAAWNNAETGDNRIGLDNALKISARTGVGLDYIYRGDTRTVPYAIATEIEKLEAQTREKRA